MLELVSDALTSAAARDRGLFRGDLVQTMLRDPNAHRTNLDGSTLWQLALLEFGSKRIVPGRTRPWGDQAPLTWTVRQRWERRRQGRLEGWL